MTTITEFQKLFASVFPTQADKKLSSYCKKTMLEDHYYQLARTTYEEMMKKYRQKVNRFKKSNLEYRILSKNKSEYTPFLTKLSIEHKKLTAEFSQYMKLNAELSRELLKNLPYVGEVSLEKIKIPEEEYIYRLYAESRKRNDEDVDVFDEYFKRVFKDQGNLSAKNKLTMLCDHFYDIEKNKVLNERRRYITERETILNDDVSYQHNKECLDAIAKKLEDNEAETALIDDVIDDIIKQQDRLLYEHLDTEPVLQKDTEMLAKINKLYQEDRDG